MARVKGGTVSRARRKKVLKLAKGYFGSKHTLYKTANEQVMHSFRYAYNDRRKLKGNMRKIWITRINAAARMNDLSYSRLMHGLKLANITGIIDADYVDNPNNEGHIMLAFWNPDSSKVVQIEKGECVAQGIFQKYLNKAERVFSKFCMEKKCGSVLLHIACNS